MLSLHLHLIKQAGTFCLCPVSSNMHKFSEYFLGHPCHHYSSQNSPHFCSPSSYNDAQSQQVNFLVLFHILHSVFDIGHHVEH